MKIALIGATGFVGRALLNESLHRGHTVTAIARDPDALPVQPGMTAVRGDIRQSEALAALLAGHDAVISAFNPAKDDTGSGIRSLLEGVRRSGVKRLLVVGGAGSLEVSPGRRLVDEPDFPAQWKQGALRTAEFLETLRTERELDWTYFSPAPLLEPGQRTGVFRLGGDQLLDPRGRISVEDYAVAMLDEAERHEHPRQRFSIAY